MYLVCFWLVIGYCFLGYGTRQYEPLNIPPYCQTLGISRQTDPRRRNFVRLQAVIFISASVGFVVAIIHYFQLKRIRDEREVLTLGQAALAAGLRAQTDVNVPQGSFQCFQCFQIDNPPLYLSQNYALKFRLRTFYTYSLLF